MEVVKVEPGCAVTVEQLRRPMEVHRPAMLFVVHVESSTGVLQPLEGLGELCRQLVCVGRKIERKSIRRKKERVYVERKSCNRWRAWGNSASS